MIQRIQSLYLLAVTVLMAVLCFVPVGEFAAPAGLYNMTLSGVCKAGDAGVAYSTLPLLLLAIVVSLLSLVTIFLYKNRKLQIKITTVNLVLILLFYVASAVYLFLINGFLQTAFSLAPVAAIIPFAAFISNVLAIRAIRADELLVRSLDRLR
jgi:hypothetical protein